MTGTRPIDVVFEKLRECRQQLAATRDREQQLRESLFRLVNTIPVPADEFMRARELLDTLYPMKVMRV